VWREARSLTTSQQKSLNKKPHRLELVGSSENFLHFLLANATPFAGFKRISTLKNIYDCAKKKVG
jgi:hypothetical protein